MDGRLKIQDWTGLLAIAVALAAIILNGQYRAEDRLRSDIDKVQTGLENVRTEMSALGERMATVEARLGSLERRVDRIAPPLPTGKHSGPVGR